MNKDFILLILTVIGVTFCIYVTNNNFKRRNKLKISLLKRARKRYSITYHEGEMSFIDAKTGEKKFYDKWLVLSDDDNEYGRRHVFAVDTKLGNQINRAKEMMLDWIYNDYPEQVKRKRRVKKLRSGTKVWYNDKIELENG